MLSIVLLTPSIANSGIPPCLIVTIRVSSKFGALKERFYNKRIYLQVLKTSKPEKSRSPGVTPCEGVIRHLFRLQDLVLIK
jgi:hypothetical protein